jgi:flavin-dependent dehydrogenase
VGDLKRLYGDGVLLAGDAGKFVTVEGAGSYTAMASGVAAALTVRHALENGDFSRHTLREYLSLLGEEGLLEVQSDAQEKHVALMQNLSVYNRQPEHVVGVARRSLERWKPHFGQYPVSIVDDVYRSLIKPVTPWYGRILLGLATRLDGLHYRKVRARSSRGSTRT